MSNRVRRKRNTPRPQQRGLNRTPKPRREGEMARERTKAANFQHLSRPPCTPCGKRVYLSIEEAELAIAAAYGIAWYRCPHDTTVIHLTTRGRA